MREIDQRARALTVAAIDDADERWRAAWSAQTAQRTRGWIVTLDTLGTMHEHLLAARTVISDADASVSSVATLSRTVVECGARAWWTATCTESEHPDVRRLLELLHGIKEFDRIRKRDDVMSVRGAPDEEWKVREAWVESTIAQMEADEGVNVERDKNGRVLALDGVRRPTMGAVLESFFSAQGLDNVGVAMYHQGSAVAHGQAGASDLMGNLDPSTGSRSIEGPRTPGDLDLATTMAGAALVAEWYALASCQIRWGMLDEIPPRPGSINDLRRYTAAGPSGITPAPRNSPCPCQSGRKYKLCHGS